MVTSGPYSTLRGHDLCAFYGRRTPTKVSIRIGIGVGISMGIGIDITRWETAIAFVTVVTTDIALTLQTAEALEWEERIENETESQRVRSSERPPAGRTGTASPANQAHLQKINFNAN
jgi:hypothetical protein